MILTIVISLLATTLIAVNANEIQSGMILGGANTEFGVGSHIFYVMYPGIENAEPGKAKFVIMKTDANLTQFESIHTYTVEQGREATPYTHFFGLKDETPESKFYSVKFCKGDGESDCSKPSSPPTWIDNGEATLDCKEISEEVQDIKIPSVKKYADEQELQQYKEKVKKSLAATDGIEKNPSYKEKTAEGGYIYSLIYYPLHKFKTLFEVSGDTDGYCKRKYTFMVLTHLVDKNTKMILKRGRFTPVPLSGNNIETYITGANAQDAPIEFKLDVTKEEAQKSDLEIWQTVCISAKDMVSTRKEGLSARCSQPFTQDWDNSQV